MFKSETVDELLELDGEKGKIQVLSQFIKDFSSTRNSIKDNYSSIKKSLVLLFEKIKNKVWRRFFVTLINVKSEYKGFDL